jgi:hypothetical protein
MLAAKTRQDPAKAIQDHNGAYTTGSGWQRFDIAVGQ